MHFLRDVDVFSCRGLYFATYFIASSLLVNLVLGIVATSIMYVAQLKTIKKNSLL